METKLQSVVIPKPLLYGLAALPLFNCIVNQLNSTLHPSFGSLSMLQIINGPLLLMYVSVVIWVAVKSGASLRSLPLPVPGAILLIGIACTQELVRTGSLSMVSIGAYGQMLYWVCLWAAVAVLRPGRAQVDIILRGLVVGAIATGISVVLGFMVGTKQYYGSDAVYSSAGWFDTAKMITGPLIVGGILLIYLGRRKHIYLCSFLASFCFMACILTYARAGWVAMGAAILWMFFWAALLAKGHVQRRWLIPFLSLCLIAGAVLPAVVGVDKLTARWTDIGQGEQAGSGRATFWKIALDQYVEAPGGQQAFGRGYNAMAEMLFREYGMDIRHTHNDLLDMLTVAGICGAAWLLLLIAYLFLQVARSSISSVEGAASMAILLTYLFHGQFTGQLWGTDAMSYYVVALACLYSNAREIRELAPAALHENMHLTFNLQPKY